MDPVSIGSKRKLEFFQQSLRKKSHSIEHRKFENDFETWNKIGLDSIYISIYCEKKDKQYFR